MDVIAWQCKPTAGGKPQCGGPGFFGSLADHAFFLAGAHRALAGAVIPLLLIGIFYWLSGNSFHYEAVGPQQGAGSPGKPAELGQTRLEHPDFWRGSAQVRALRLIHTGVAVNAVAHSLAACMWASVNTQPDWAGRVTVGASIIAGLGLIAGLVGLAHPAVRIRGLRRGGIGLRLLLLSPLTTGAVALAVATFAAVHAERATPGHASPTMPGLDGTLRIAFLLMLVILMVLMLLTVRQAETSGQLDRGADSTVWMGLAAPVFLSVSWLIAIVYSIALLFGAQRLMGGPEGPSHARFITTMQWNAAGVLAASVLVFCLATVAAGRAARIRRAEARAVRSQVDETNVHAYQRAEAVGAARGMHRYVEYAALSNLGWMAGSLLLVLVGVTLIAVGRHVDFRRPQVQPDWSVFGFTLPDAPGSGLTSAASALATVILLSLVGLGYAAHRYPIVLRTLGTLWDIVTFWPRGAHPFGPPCYAEQAVPQLVTRIAGRATVPIVLAGHSQGSVLSAAAVAQLSVERRRSLFLLTFGCQLTPLYGRVFPAFFAREGRERLATLLGGDAMPGDGSTTQPPWADVRWRNLYRDTDFLGWPVGPGPDNALGVAVDRQVIDPPGLDLTTGAGLLPVQGEILDPPIRTHFDYPLTPEYLRERSLAADRLTSQTVSAPADGSMAATPAPVASGDRRFISTAVLSAVVAIALTSVLLGRWPVSTTGQIKVTDNVRAATPSTAEAVTPSETPLPSLSTSIVPSGDHPAKPKLHALLGAEHLAGIAVSRDGGTLYASDIENNRVLKVDTASWTATPISLRGRPRSLALDPSEKHLYVTLFADGCDAEANDKHCEAPQLSVVDLTKDAAGAPRLLAKNGYGVVVDPRTGDVLIPDHAASTLVVLDVATNTRRQVKVAESPHSVALEPGTHTVYLAVHEKHAVVQLDLDSGAKRTINLPKGSGPHFVARSPTEKLLYVADFYRDKVVVIHPGKKHPLDSTEIPVGHNPQAIAFAPDGEHAYVVNNGSSTLSVIKVHPKDGRVGSVVDTLKLPDDPTSIVVSSNGKYAYVSALKSGSVTQVEIGS